MVIGVAQGGLRGGDTDEVLRQFVAQTGVTFEIARDTDNGYSLFRRSLPESSISPFPLDVVVDPDGRLVSARGEYDPAALEAEIEPLLNP